MLGTTPASSARATSRLHHWANSPAQVIYLFINQFIFFHHGSVCSIWRLKFLPLFAVIGYISHLPVVDTKHFPPHSSALHYVRYCLFCVGQMISGMGNSFVLSSSDEKLQVKEKLFLGEDLYWGMWETTDTWDWMSLKIIFSGNRNRLCVLEKSFQRKTHELNDSDSNHSEKTLFRELGIPLCWQSVCLAWLPWVSSPASHKTWCRVRVYNSSTQSWDKRFKI